MSEWVQSILSGLISAGIITTILGFLLQNRAAHISEDLRSLHEKSMTVFLSTRTWKEKSVSELMGPLYMQFDRTRRAFARWQGENLYLEAKVIREGNIAIRDLLLSKSHLIPPLLLDDAGKLVEHFDRWLEEFEKERGSKARDLQSAFVFVGPQGFPFPREAEKKFIQAFKHMWADLYEGQSA